ncbi:C40 family peptidase [Cohnella rhizosphaerae]|uniref:C40 family peptidase n=1 Tax=Cohnella rhizosphaerae TaxID=1457232 RepID=A0A9X4QX27_9BACL|nr:C40 family peptidase [Cohnella rhizosphaerae]MDG0812982.1 C40 family peptidase [Cohnella rhizosphaerae]
MSANIRSRTIRKFASLGLCVAIAVSGTLFVSAPRAAAAASKTAKADKIITLGKQYLGVKYRLGAPSGSTKVFDCSSFTQYIFGKYGVKLPRVSSAQATKGKTVAKAQLKKGDLVFFKSSNSSKIGHVAVYIGNNKILHTYGKPGVTVTSLSASYWKSHYKTARRVL